MTDRCFHCSLENPADTQYTLTIFNQTQHFCCPGCHAVAQMIIDSGQTDFYKFRTQSNNKVDPILPQELQEIEAFDNQQINQALVEQSLIEQSDNFQTIQLGIEGITCAACGWLIKKQISQLAGVLSIEVNTSNQRAIIQFNENTSLSAIFKKIRALGYKAFPYSQDKQEAVIEKQDKTFVKRLIIAGLAMMQVMMFSTGLYIGEFQDIAKNHATFLHWVSGFLATPVVFYSALPFIQSAINNVRFAQLGMNVPVSIAILSAYFASVYSLIFDSNVFYFDSVVMFTFFLLLGRYFEHHARYKAVQKQQNFRKLLPLSVTKIQDGKYFTIPVAKVQSGDQLLINAGSVIPIDGKLTSQNAEINEAVLSGESLPSHKIKDDLVFSGSTNVGASFEMTTTATLKNSRIQKLIQLQQNSENLTSNSVTLADKIARGYVVGLLLLSVVTAIVWWQINPDNVFPVVLSLLVVSCPCALSLATPAAFASAISKLTDQGLMLKSSDLLTKLKQIERVIFDKTGTLTQGNFEINQIILMGSKTEKECLAIAQTLEKISNHPISFAFKQKDLKNMPSIDAKEVISGGIEGVWQNNHYKIGRLSFVTDSPFSENNLSNANSSSTSVYLSENNQIIAEFLLSDTIKNDAKDVINALNKINIHTEILSGDNSQACEKVAKKLNINSFQSEKSPEQKLTYLQQLSPQKTLMVGDGINDIGAFKAAFASISVGNSSHLSRASASAVLVSHDLNTISDAIKLAGRLDTIIKQNLTWAVVYNLCAIPFALMGLVPAWLAAIGMTSSSLIVVLNALRLRK